MPGWIGRLRNFLGLERNVAAASGAIFLLGFGEELWKKFLPKYLEALGASTPIIGLFGTAEDLFDAVYASDGRVNLKSRRKAAALSEAFPDGFVYAGNERADLKVWEASAFAVLVNTSGPLTRQCQARFKIERHFARE